MSIEDIKYHIARLGRYFTKNGLTDAQLDEYVNALLNYSRVIGRIVENFIRRSKTSQGMPTIDDLVQRCEAYGQYKQETKSSGCQKCNGTGLITLDKNDGDYISACDCSAGQSVTKNHNIPVYTQLLNKGYVLSWQSQIAMESLDQDLFGNQIDLDKAVNNLAAKFSYQEVAYGK